MGDKKSMEKLGKKLKEIREKKKLTQAELAVQAGIHANYYARIERGEVMPRIDIVNEIIKALGIKSSDILPF